MKDTIDLEEGTCICALRLNDKTYALGFKLYLNGESNEPDVGLNDKLL